MPETGRSPGGHGEDAVATIFGASTEAIADPYGEQRDVNQFSGCMRMRQRLAWQAMP